MTAGARRRLFTLPPGGVDPQAVMTSLLEGELQHERSPIDAALFGLAWAARKGVPITAEARLVLHALVDALPERAG